MYVLGELKFTYIIWLSLTQKILSHEFRFWKWADFSSLDINRQDMYGVAKDHEGIHFAFHYKPMDGTLACTTTEDQSGPGSNSNLGAVKPHHQMQ